MKAIDYKHVAYHVLVALYFVWFVVFACLLAMALVHYLNNGNHALSRALVLWMLFNLVMGTVLFIVIRLFRKSNVTGRIILYTYFLMAASCVTVMLIMGRF